MSRALGKKVSALAERLQAANPEYEFKMFPDKEEGEPGYAIQRKRAGELWHDVGWATEKGIVWRDFFMKEGTKQAKLHGF